MVHQNKSPAVLLIEQAQEFQEAASRLESQCWKLLPEPYSERARNQILKASRCLKLYKRYSEAGTYQCLEAEIQAKHFRESLERAAQACADGLNIIETRKGNVNQTHIQIGQTLAQWAGRKISTFPDKINTYTYEFIIC